MSESEVAICAVHAGILDRCILIFVFALMLSRLLDYSRCIVNRLLLHSSVCRDEESRFKPFHHLLEKQVRLIFF